MEPGPAERVVDGLLVVKDEPLLSPLSARLGRPVPFPTIRFLTLADRSTRHACADCPDVVGTRGEVKKHRIDHHGEATGAARRKAGTLPGGQPVLSPNALSMTLGELIQVANAVDGWEDTHALVEAERDAWRERALAAERRLAAFERALSRIPGFKLVVED